MSNRSITLTLSLRHFHCSITVSLTKDGRVNVLYSTPYIREFSYFYNDEVNPRISHSPFMSLPLHFKAATHNLESSNMSFKTQFVRYVDHLNAYWTGHFTSRPSFKGLHENNEWLLSARQLEFFKGRNESVPNNVAADYANRISIGYDEAEGLVASALALLVNQRSSSHVVNPATGFQQLTDVASEPYSSLNRRGSCGGSNV